MIPTILIQAALLVVLVRSAYRFVQRLNHRSRDWLELLFDLSVALLALWVLLD